MKSNEVLSQKKRKSKSSRHSTPDRKNEDSVHLSEDKNDKES